MSDSGMRGAEEQVVTDGVGRSTSNSHGEEGEPLGKRAKVMPSANEEQSTTQQETQQEKQKEKQGEQRKKKPQRKRMKAKVRRLLEPVRSHNRQSPRACVRVPVSVCLFLCVCVCVCFCLCPCLCVCLHLCVHLCPSICLHFCPSICLHLCIHLCPSLYLCVCGSGHELASSLLISTCCRWLWFAGDAAQLAFYFSDANLRRDGFMKKQIDQDPEGCACVGGLSCRSLLLLLPPPCLPPPLPSSLSPPSPLPRFPLFFFLMADCPLCLRLCSLQTFQSSCS